MTTEPVELAQRSEGRPSTQHILGETLVKLGLGGAAVSVSVGLIEAIGPKPFEARFAIADAAFVTIAGIGKFIQRRGSRQQR